MRQLAVECSGKFGSVAALEGTDVLEDFLLDSGRRTAQTLAPAIARLLRQVAWQPRDVELVSVTEGPGSFTGLRIGVTTAKTFAYATGAALVGVNSLRVIAEQSPLNGERLWCVMNAEREQFFAACFQRDAGGWRESEPTRIVDMATWLGQLRDDDLVSGPGLETQGLVSRVPAVCEATCWLPRAAMVGIVGLRDFQAGQYSDCWSLLPQYFRESAATEKARRKTP